MVTILKTSKMKDEVGGGITGENICSDGLISLLGNFSHYGQKKDSFPLFKKINFRSCSGELRLYRNHTEISVLLSKLLRLEVQGDVPAWKPCSIGGRGSSWRSRQQPHLQAIFQYCPSVTNPFLIPSTVHSCNSCRILSRYFNYIKCNKRCKCDFYSWTSCHLITQNNRILKGRVLNIVMPKPVFIASFCWLKSPNL